MTGSRIFALVTSTRTYTYARMYFCSSINRATLHLIYLSVVHTSRAGYSVVVRAKEKSFEEQTERRRCVANKSASVEVGQPLRSSSLDVTILFTPTRTDTSRREQQQQLAFFQLSHRYGVVGKKVSTPRRHPSPSCIFLYAREGHKRAKRVSHKRPYRGHKYQSDGVIKGAR